MLHFPLDDVVDEQACSDFLVRVLHPDGWRCPHGPPLPTDQAAHDRHQAPILDYRCRSCGAVFNRFTGTSSVKPHDRCSTIVQILRGIAQGVPTKHLAEELGIDRGQLLERRPRIQALVAQQLSPCGPLPDEVTEADELYQNAGAKGRARCDPADPPRRRTNKARGHGCWETDCVPVAEVVDRQTGQIRLQVYDHSDRASLQPFIAAHTRPDDTVNTDEWRAYDHLPETGRSHAPVSHTPGRREWACDDDGDGVCEVHNNTMEGIWTGLRNFLRPFRGVSKWFLSQYVTIFEWAHNLKRVTTTFLRAMMVACTSEPT